MTVQYVDILEECVDLRYTIEYYIGNYKLVGCLLHLLYNLSNAEMCSIHPKEHLAKVKLLYGQTICICHPMHYILVIFYLFLDTH